MTTEPPIALETLWDATTEGSTRVNSAYNSTDAFAQARQNAEEFNAVSAGTSIQELPPVDRGRKAWAFCFSAFILETMVWGFGFSFGVFQEYYTSHAPFNTSSAIAISAVGTTGLALQYGECLVILAFYRRYPDLIKPSMWFGLVLSTACLFASSFATKVWQLILLQGVCFGLGAGLLYVPVIIWLPEWFVERRGLAGGFIFGGSGIGGFAFPLIMNQLLTAVGFRWTLRIWAGLMLVVCSLAILGCQPRIPLPKFRRQQRRLPLMPPSMPYLSSPIFWAFSLSNIFQALSYFPVSLYIAVFASSISSPLSATAVLSIFNSSSIVGQILIGHLSDRYPYPWIMFGSGLGSALAAFLLWGFSGTLAQVFVFAIIFGSLGGGFSSVWPAAAADYSESKPEQNALVFGTFAAMKGIAAVIGPIFAGLLHETGKSAAMSAGYGRFGFGKVEIFVGSCAVVTTLGSIVVGRMKNRVVRG